MPERRKCVTGSAASFPRHSSKPWFRPLALKLPARPTPWPVLALRMTNPPKRITIKRINIGIVYMLYSFRLMIPAVAFGLLLLSRVACNKKRD